MSDDLFAKLSELPPLDINELAAVRIRKRAHQVLEQARQGQPSASLAQRTILILQNTVMGAVAAGYLFWVVDSVLIPYR